MCGGGNGIEPDVSEEDNAGGPENSENSTIRVGDALSRDVSGWGGNHRGVVCRIDEPPADADEEQHNAHLEDNNETIDESRFFRAADKQEREEKENENRRDVHQSMNPGEVMFERRMRPLVRYPQPEPIEHAIGVLAPRDGNCGCRDRVFED